MKRAMRKHYSHKRMTIQASSLCQLKNKLFTHEKIFVRIGLSVRSNTFA
jgi:hypothetical protein